MSYQVLARKYRPQKFSEVIGQEHVTRTLKNAIEQGRTAHGYIFSGHRGIGKTTIARILAMALNCRSKDHPVTEPCGVCESCTEVRAGNSVDVIEIDAATNRGIDEIRELREAARYRPARDRFKIYILDEAHQITDAAFNALLKTLEEPPGHVVFMLATTAPEDIPQTIRSRCQHFSFRAVRFEEILGQLRDLLGREKLEADEDALALLAEAGDGSMRDALSILDQAIASSTGRLTAESVRQLVGAAPSGVLEEVMQAVARSASEEVLRLADKLISEGQNPAHFARQLVRFLRNTLVAKVAGRDSSLLQISGDERTRVARIADLFSEEDLARHLQIMLRTFNELGYRQEQRFHLELGLLKMAHAQRLLPIEQLLSEAGSAAGTVPQARPGGRPAIVPENRGAPGTSARKFCFALCGRLGAQDENRDVVGSCARDRAAHRDQCIRRTRNPWDGCARASRGGGRLQGACSGKRTAPASLPELASSRLDSVRNAVLNALGDAGHRMLVSMLETGEWSIEGSELVIKVAASATVIDMSVGADARRLAIATASGAMGRAVKLKVLPGGTAQAAPARPAATGNGGGRARAEQDPIVQRMREKFGAEIRTIIDQRDKK